MTDELGEALESCFFPFGAYDPPSADPLVPRGLGTEEFPGGFVRAKLFFLSTSKAGGLALFVCVNTGFFLATRGEGFEANGMHQALLCELSDEVDIDRAPGAGGLAGSEANRVAGFVEALADAIDPAEAESYFYGFGPSDARFFGTFFVKAHELLAELVMMGFEPVTELGWRWKEFWFWGHDVT
jgi:hypothetical protein